MHEVVDVAEVSGVGAFAQLKACLARLDDVDDFAYEEVIAGPEERIRSTVSVMLFSLPSADNVLQLLRLVARTASSAKALISV